VQLLEAYVHKTLSRISIHHHDPYTPSIPRHHLPNKTTYTLLKMTFALRLRTIARPAFQQTRLITQSSRLSANEYGQGKSNAVGGVNNSKVPEGVQKAAPKGVEEALPDSVRFIFPNSRSCSRSVEVHGFL
jgi:hypothetical protein